MQEDFLSIYGTLGKPDGEQNPSVQANMVPETAGHGQQPYRENEWDRVPEPPMDKEEVRVPDTAA